MNDTVSHGDDLAYLFDPQDVYGTPLFANETLSDEDLSVRERFTQMIVDFMKDDVVKIDGNPIPIFSATSNNFIQVGPELQSAKDFRYCELALWGGLMERLQSTTCQLFNTVKTATNVFNNVINLTNPDAVETANIALQAIPKQLGTVQTPRSPKKPNRVPFLWTG